MTRPVVAIVGRPNVGKSSLLNRFAGRRVSIVEPTAGVTRDRITVPIEHDDRHFDLVDTGGLGLVDENLLKAHIEAQIETALAHADLVLFVVDHKDGCVPGDEFVAQRLRRLQRPVLLVVNKVESHLEGLTVSEWAKLGFGEPFAVSAVEGFGINDLLAAIVDVLPARKVDEAVDAPPMLRFAIVGKRNSGKSTLVNRLAGEERMIVSEIPGTTRDAVDVVFEWEGKRLCAIDTAGLRKKRSIEHAIELFSMGRAQDSIRRADVVVHMFDVREELSQVDKKLAHFYLELARPVLIVGNKIDLAESLDLEKWDSYVKQQLPGLHFAPVSFLSAKEGTNVAGTLGVLLELHAQAGLQVPTPRLNAFLQEARTRLVPKSRGRMPKVFYGTQIGTHPLSLVVFVNDVTLFRGHNYERYLANAFREHFGAHEVPVRIVFRDRQRAPRGAGSTGRAPQGGGDGIAPPRPQDDAQLPD
ncbi:MAG: ribosome biogenesis GTPase Der [Planctomycetes bacterium]|nr:ribosome biogenesis GTPase Der [Planctomycetota bacterium]